MSSPTCVSLLIGLLMAQADSWEHAHEAEHVLGSSQWSQDVGRALIWAPISTLVIMCHAQSSHLRR